MKQSLAVESARQSNNHSHQGVSKSSPVAQTINDNRESTAIQRQLITNVTHSTQAIAQAKLNKQFNSGLKTPLQRHKVANTPGTTVQRLEAEEELLQGQFETVQREVEEEELMQGKFEVAQRFEEEELMQGKFDTLQCVEEEELLQGKFDKF